MITVDLDIRGTATSGYTSETIAARLKALENRADEEAKREREYLTRLTERPPQN